MMKKQKSSPLNHVAILAHVLTTVPVVDLEEFFLARSPEHLLTIHHPLSEASTQGSHYKLYRSSTLHQEGGIPRIKLPFLMQYGLDTILSLFWLLQHGPRWDIIIALDNLNTLAALLLRSLGLADKVVYYAIDYVPQRFGAPIINEIYHKIDDYCATHADSVWNVSPRIAEARDEHRGIPAQSSRQQVVPIGIWIDRFPFQKYSEIDPYHVVYAGGLLPHQGVQNFLVALPQLVKKYPKLHLSIIGLGTYEKDLQKLVRELNLENSVQFLGYFENHDDVAEFCTRCGLAIALYSQELDIWSRYADPSKMKTYLAAGLPILTTDVTFFAEIIARKKSGIVTDSSPEAITAAVGKILSTPRTHQSFRDHARALASEYQWSDIFESALKKTQ